jgi:hypothetical protein
LPATLLDGSQDDPHLRREQLRRLRQQFGFHLFNDATKQLLRNWMTPTALSTDKAIVLLSKMRHEQIIVPALSVLEDFLHGIIQEVNQQTYQSLTAKLSPQQREMLSLLLANRDDSDKSYVHWLQQPAGKSNVNNLLAILDRLTFLQKMKLGVPENYSVNANRRLMTPSRGTASSKILS